MNLLRIIILAFIGLFASKAKAYRDVELYEFQGLSNDVASLRNEFVQWTRQLQTAWRKSFRGKTISYKSCDLKIQMYFQQICIKSYFKSFPF